MGWGYCVQQQKINFVNKKSFKKEKIVNKRKETRQTKVKKINSSIHKQISWQHKKQWKEHLSKTPNNKINQKNKTRKFHFDTIKIYNPKTKSKKLEWKQSKGWKQNPLNHLCPIASKIQISCQTQGTTQATSHLPRQSTHDSQVKVGTKTGIKCPK